MTKTGLLSKSGLFLSCGCAQLSLIHHQDPIASLCQLHVMGNDDHRLSLQIKRFLLDYKLAIQRIQIFEIVFVDTQAMLSI